MINFYRKLRKKLIEEGKVANYLKYALGEIILVVIGILIALQINTWNNNLQDKQKSIVFHTRLIEDVDRVIERAKTLNERANTTLTAITNSVAVLEKGEIATQQNQADLDSALLRFSRFNYQQPELPTWEEMKSNGELDLIYSISLRNNLAEFNSYLFVVASIYKTLGEGVYEELSLFDKYVRSYVDPVILKVTNKFDFDAMAAHPVFINRFSRISLPWRGSAYFSSQVERNAIPVKQELQKELDKLTQ
ncbi:DUF6090 family protein [Glaciecola sp. 1036]|uniref:DUF6090 family protein n=1 Tax=Alteromonadaceae TaxID=72275 RepID=UPI003CFEC2FE